MKREKRDHAQRIVLDFVAYLLAADWVIEALAGREPTVSVLRRLRGSRVAICWVTVAEVYEGAYGSPNPEGHLISMRRFLSAYRVLGVDDAIAQKFAELRAELRRRGQMISDLDIFVAATAIVYDLTVITLNRRHFERIRGLQLHRLTP